MIPPTSGSLVRLSSGDVQRLTRRRIESVVSRGRHSTESAVCRSTWTPFCHWHCSLASSAPATNSQVWNTTTKSEVGPSYIHLGCLGDGVSCSVELGSGAKSRLRSILMHISFKIWHRVATNLMIFLTIDWPNFMQNFRILRRISICNLKINMRRPNWLISCKMQSV